MIKYSIGLIALAAGASMALRLWQQAKKLKAAQAEQAKDYVVTITHQYETKHAALKRDKNLHLMKKNHHKRKP